MKRHLHFDPELFLFEFLLINTRVALERLLVSFVATRKPAVTAFLNYYLLFTNTLSACLRLDAQHNNLINSYNLKTTTIIFHLKQNFSPNFKDN